MSFPRYPKYKDSGVEWLRQVPAHWDVAPFKHHIERNDGGVWGDEPTGEGDTLVLRSTEQTVDGRWALEDPATRHLTPTERASALLREGDLLVTKSSGSALHIGKTTLVTDEIAAMGCCYSNFMQRLRTSAGFTPKLGWYLMNSQFARLQFDLLSNSTTGLANLNGSIIGQMMVAAPPLSEQRAIVAVLDGETAKIDALIAEQERLIELLKEKRQAVISHAVTKGLNPDVTMKDSGVEWLGEVPAHWRIVKVKHFLRSIDQGWSPQCESYPAESVEEWGVLKVGCVNGGRFDPTENKALPADLSPKSEFGIAAGDLLISRANTRDLVGSAAVSMADHPNLMLCDKLYRLRPDVERCSPQFLALYLALPTVRAQIEIAATGASSSMLNISQATILDLRVALPPLLEQMEIEANIDIGIGRLDALMADTEAASGLLRERRAALVSAAVTGQIDVRGLTDQTNRGVHSASMPA